MDYQHWLERFRSLIGELESREGFEVRYSIGPPVEEVDMRISEARIASRSGVQDFRIPSPLREFFLVTSGFDFQWVLMSPPEPHRPFAGMFNMATYGELFVPAEEETPNVAENTDAGFSLYGQYRNFDNLGPKFQVLAKFIKGVNEPELYWHVAEEDGHGRLSRLLIGFDQYLEYALAACCLFPWQKLFLEDSALLSTEEEEEFFARLDFLSPLSDGKLLQSGRRPTGLKEQQ